MSKTQLKNRLESLPKERIISIVLELYDARKEAREFLDFYLSPNEHAKLAEYKNIIREEFFPRRGEPKCRFRVCNKAISDFKKLQAHPSSVADLMLYYIEIGVTPAVLYGDMWEQYYISLETNFAKAMEYIAKNGCLPELRSRIETMLKSVEKCGWGFPDALYEIYEQHQ